MKRLAIPLYKIIKENKFIWTQVEAESYANLLYLMGLQIRNYIFDPTKPLMLMADGSCVESSILIFQWNPDLLSLDMVTTKSMLLSNCCYNQEFLFFIIKLVALNQNFLNVCSLDDWVKELKCFSMVIMVQ